jgi:hypothetical protein
VVTAVDLMGRFAILIVAAGFYMLEKSQPSVSVEYSPHPG